MLTKYYQAIFCLFVSTLCHLKTKYHTDRQTGERLLSPPSRLHRRCCWQPHRQPNRLFSSRLLRHCMRSIPNRHSTNHVPCHARRGRIDVFTNISSYRLSSGPCRPKTEYQLFGSGVCSTRWILGWIGAGRCHG